VIVHRTALGKKFRLTKTDYKLYGAMLDSTLPEEDEELKREMYGRLEYARAFIATKRSEIAVASLGQTMRGL
jgi:hypothetical protein